MVPWPLGAEREGVEISTEGQSLGDLHTWLWSGAGTANLVNIPGLREASSLGGGGAVDGFTPVQQLWDSQSSL